MTSTTNRRKILVPLATLLAAGAVAVGSGATFTSTTNSAVAVTSGSLSHSNSNVSMELDDLKPGDTVTGSVEITNDGTLDSTLALTEVNESNAFEADKLHLTITQAGNATPLYDGEFGDTGETVTSDLGDLNVGDSTTITFAVSLASDAGNDNQGKAAEATYQWVTTQKPGQSNRLF